MKLLPAGKLKNLNDFVVGASVLTASGLVGYISRTNKKCTMAGTDEVCKIQADIKYPSHGTSYHSYRHDGRSTYDAEHDIVRVCRPEDSKVKAIKVWSKETLDFEMLEAANNLAMICKLYIDTDKAGKNWKGNTKPSIHKGFAGVCKLGKSGILSVKIWRT